MIHQLKITILVVFSNFPTRLAEVVAGPKAILGQLGGCELNQREVLHSEMGVHGD